MSRITNKKSPVQQISVMPADATRRIDNFLLGLLKGVPKTRIYQMLRRGEVRVNKGRVKQGYRLLEGDIVRIPPVMQPERENAGAPPAYLVEMVTSSILFETDELIALNKPSGIVVHSGSGRSFGIIEVLRHVYPQLDEIQLVHRLDQATSGCLVVSKNVASLRSLHEAFKSGKVEKKYLALLKGQINKQLLKVDLPLKKNIRQSGERLVKIDTGGKHARTVFRKKRVFRETTLAEISISTGRTHQIRVHAQAIEHPLAGDEKYGNAVFNRQLRKAGLRRLFLHATELSFPGFGSGGLTINAPLTAELQDFLDSHV